MRLTCRRIFAFLQEREKIMSSVLFRGLAFVLLAWICTSSHAQSYPSKSIRFIVPFPPGGSVDVLARIIAQKMSENLDQQIVIDNRAGAAGSVGTSMTAKSSPDGYTLLFTSLSPIVINVSMYSGKPPYDPEKDLAPISLITKTPAALFTHLGVPVRTVKDIISYAKANPGKMSYGSSGTGSVGHLTGELFRAAVGIDLLHVPYKGGGQGLIALLSKEVDMIIFGLAGILPYVRSGQLRSIAVSGATRSPALPDTPTIAESGVPGFDATVWYCLMGPAGIPRPIIDTTRASLIKAITAPPVSERLLAEGALPEPSTPEELGKLIHGDIKRWAKAVQMSGAKLD
jgi:tripartite-type tricarboxylate transporter receptor subunit TctC